ncbi:MAG: stalk domain-containing protein, partial [Armatimonadota bacterium]
MALQRLAPAATMLAMAAVGVSPAFAQQAPVVRGNAAEMRILRPIVNEVIAPGVFFLELSFQSRTAAGIRAAELHVDGVRWARRDFETALAKYVLSFEVDGRTLAAGSHRVVVKLIAEDGGVSEAELPLQVDAPRATAPVKPSNSGYGPEMAFRSLPKKLVGTVEIGVDIKEANLNPYVSFFVDRQFKTLKNYPPYAFIWDTTTVSNGYHVVEATGYLESSNATSTQRMQVYVDNPGGFTPKAVVAPSATPDPSVKPSVARPVEIKPAVTPAAAAARLSAVPAAVARIAPSALSIAAEPVVDAAPSGIAGVVPGGVTVLALRTNRIAPAVEANRTVVSGMGLSAAPAMVASLPVGRPVAIAPVSPSAPRMAVATSTGPVRRAAATVTPRPMAPVVTPLAKLPELSARNLMVAFDGVQIAFDVQPRIENGLPLAPFRQIFEHTGGTVTWAHSAKTVRAVNTEREIVFKVGGGAARVN